MPIVFERGICRDLDETVAREWLVSNGKGGYASGTVAGMLTRLQHGLLVASPQEGLCPQLLIAKIDEEVVFDRRTYYLGTNEYRDGTLNPAGFAHLETFRLEEGFPVFTYHLGGIDGMMLEKRIWMPQGQDTTYIQYRLLRTTSQPDSAPWKSRMTLPSSTRLHDVQRSLSLTLLPFAAYRASHETQHGALDWQFQVETLSIESDESVAGCAISAHEGARPFHIFAVGHADSESAFLPTGVWYWNVLHRAEQGVGRAATSDLYLPGVFRTTLWPGEDVSFTIILTAEDVSWLTFNTRHLKRAYYQAVDEQRSILQVQRYFGEGGETALLNSVLPLPEKDGNLPQDEEFLRLLVQAAGRLVVERATGTGEEAMRPAPFLPETKKTPCIISGYYDGQEHTRDTLIALPGLLLAAHRYAEARRMLVRLGRAFHQGLLPDRAPGMARKTSQDGSGEYSVDTALWYFYALDHYMRATRDVELLESLASVLVECIDWYRRGTLNGIGVDTQDGLLRAWWRGRALTWMNATMPGKTHTPVTPRMGKAVEVNALWYHALSLLQEWSECLKPGIDFRARVDEYEELRQQCRRSFNQRFWYASGGYLYDVIDGDGGDDSSIRPNQLLALSLRHAVLDGMHHSSVLNVVTTHLLTPCGLRTLSPHDEHYRGHIAHNEEEQPGSLHQGGVWPWLIGPYVDALLRVNGQVPGNRKNYVEERQKVRESVWRRGIDLLESFREQLCCDMLGAIGSVYDGDAPQSSHVHLASATSTGEIVRVYHLLAQMGVRFSRQTLSV